MQYFASILAYTGAVAGIQRKRKAMIRITKYLINDCSSFWIMRDSLQTVLSLAQSVTPPPPTHTHKKDRQRVACAAAETVQCLRSQTP